jgi:heme-degrading monooxygenase HmoA
MAIAGDWGIVMVWEFHVREEERQQFALIYGPSGDWAELFSRSTDYLRTELVRDVKDPTRFVTLDFWTSFEAYERFRHDHAAEYKSIDDRCEKLTEKEMEIGRFQRMRAAQEPLA